MDKMKNPYLCYFEIPADNLERSRLFYSALFDWKIEVEKGIAAPFEYFRVKHKEPEEGKKEDHHFFAGMLKRQYPGQSILIYIAVHSLKVYVDKVHALGGAIVEEKKAIPGFGYLAICKDTENNVFALWEEDHEAK